MSGTLTKHQRQHIVGLLEQGQDRSLDYKRLLFPPERHGCELAYAGNEWEEDILAEISAARQHLMREWMAVQPIWAACAAPALP